jgi:hypothetical protein
MKPPFIWKGSSNIKPSSEVTSNLSVPVKRTENSTPTFQRGANLYLTPAPKGIHTYGRFIGISSGIRYSHSPSKLKNARSAARINAYNAAQHNYY